MTETLPASTDDETDEPLELTAVQRAAFLAYIVANPRCSTREALARSGVKRRVVYRDKGGRRRTRNVELTKAQAADLIDSSPELREDYEAARGRSFEEIRAEIKRRAIDGVDEPVFHNGEVVGKIRRYSDRLLGAMAKANLPEYRDQTRVEHVGASGGPFEIEDRSASLVDLARVLEAAGALAEIHRGAAREDVPAALPLLPAPPDR